MVSVFVPSDSPPQPDLATFIRSSEGAVAENQIRQNLQRDTSLRSLQGLSQVRLAFGGFCVELCRHVSFASDNKAAALYSISTGVVHREECVAWRSAVAILRKAQPYHWREVYAASGDDLPDPKIIMRFRSSSYTVDAEDAADGPQSLRRGRFVLRGKLRRHSLASLVSISRSAPRCNGFVLQIGELAIAA